MVDVICVRLIYNLNLTVCFLNAKQRSFRQDVIENITYGIAVAARIVSQINYKAFCTCGCKEIQPLL